MTTQADEAATEIVEVLDSWIERVDTLRDKLESKVYDLSDVSPEAVAMVAMADKSQLHALVENSGGNEAVLRASVAIRLPLAKEYEALPTPQEVADKLHQQGFFASSQLGVRGDRSTSPCPMPPSKRH